VFDFIAIYFSSSITLSCQFIIIIIIFIIIKMAKISVTLVASSTFKGHFTIIKEKRVMNAVM